MNGNQEFDLMAIDYRALTPAEKGRLLSRLTQRAHAERTKAINAFFARLAGRTPKPATRDVEEFAPGV